VRIEHDAHGWPADLSGRGPQLSDESGMTKMDAVKVPNGDCPAAA
jgi:hypothetical protein